MPHFPALAPYQWIWTEVYETLWLRSIRSRGMICMD